MSILKMVEEKDASVSILVSFDQQWEAALRDSKIKVVFRKRGPKSFNPDEIFVYVGAPASQLIGRLKILSFKFLPISEAAGLAAAGGMSQSALLEYAKEYKELAVFRVGSFEPAANPRSLNDLFVQFGFHPPQSFIRLSQSGKTELVASLGFVNEQKPKRPLRK